MRGGGRGKGGGLWGAATCSAGLLLGCVWPLSRRSAVPVSSAPTSRQAVLAAAVEGYCFRPARALCGAPLLKWPPTPAPPPPCTPLQTRCASTTAVCEARGGGQETGGGGSEEEGGEREEARELGGAAGNRRQAVRLIAACGLASELVDGCRARDGRCRLSCCGQSLRC